jgi:probable H4MPT-linked C1 transfer pathway protein
VSRPFELWKRPDRLAEQLGSLAEGLPGTGPVAVTMTGELCDCFQTKRDGVRHILAAVARAFPGRRCGVWSTGGRFLALPEAERAPLEVAAANWHALATFAGRFAPDGPALLVDIGSTTTDVIPLQGGRPTPAGRTDPDRLQFGELVYTGARRTPVCALLGFAVAAELFATTHDVYLRLGLVPDELGNTATADGRPATAQFAHARLSRMLGGDPEITPCAETLELARTVFGLRRSAIVRSMETVTGRLPGPPRTVILSGSGEFLARAAADEFAAIQGPSGLPPHIVSLTERLGATVAEAACAYAIAVLTAETN